MNPALPPPSPPGGGLGRLRRLAPPGLLLAALLACASGPAPTPPPPASAPQEAPQAPQEADPEAVPTSDDLPPALLEPRDDAERVFACLAWGDEALLLPREDADRSQALAGLREAKAALRLCKPLIHNYFSGFPPLLEAFDAEWLLLLTRLALTAESFTAHNAQTVCANLRQTLRTSRQATQATARFAEWLDAQINASTRQEPLLDAMLHKARAKRDALLIASNALNQRYLHTCRTP